MSIRKTHCTRSTRILRKTLETLLTYPAPVPIWKWAEERRTMPGGVTAKPGPYSIDLTPYMKEPQEAFFDPDVQTTVLCMATRTGKTESELNLTGYTIDHDPCNMLWVYPTLDNGKRWKKDFFNPMVKASKCFRGKIRDPRLRDSENTMFSIGYPGGRISIIGANSPSAFRQIQAPRVVCEEVDAMENGPEGDPVELAFKRADNYNDAVQIVSSSPTITGRSRVWDWLERSDFRKWFCPCPHCGFHQVWVWKHVVWDDKDPGTARLKCENCKRDLDDQQRKGSVMAGEWRATKPFTGVRGYWLNRINSLFDAKKGFGSILHQGAAEFLAADRENNREKRQTWTNTFLCECFDDLVEESAKPDELEKRCEPYTPTSIPVGVIFLFGAVDVQKDRLELLVVGFGKDEECWGIWKKVFYGEVQKDEVWDELDRFLIAESQFMREDGVPLEIKRVFVDLGGFPSRTRAFCGPRLGRGVFACRGVGVEGPKIPPIIGLKPAREGRSASPHWNIGVTAAKQMIYDRLALLTPAPRSVHFAGADFGFDLHHFRQLTVEKRRKKYKHGQLYYEFVKPNNNSRNEALDMTVYCYGALYSMGRINWNREAEQLLKLRPKPPEPAPTEEEAAAKVLHAPRMVAAKSWATSW